MIKSINLGLLQEEDRLFADVVDETEIVAFHLTRRLVRRFIAMTAKLLANSNPMMAHTPFGSRNEIIIFEHQLAIQDAAVAKGTSAPQADASIAGATVPSAPTIDIPRRTTLLHTINIDVKPSHFDMHLKDAKDIAVSFGLTRAELHRLLATIHRLSQMAEWDLGQEAAWLADVVADEQQSSLRRGSWPDPN